MGVRKNVWEEMLVGNRDNSLNVWMSEKENK